MRYFQRLQSALAVVCLLAACGGDDEGKGAANQDTVGADTAIGDISGSDGVGGQDATTATDSGAVADGGTALDAAADSGAIADAGTALDVAADSATAVDGGAAPADAIQPSDSGSDPADAGQVADAVAPADAAGLTDASGQADVVPPIDTAVQADGGEDSGPAQCTAGELDRCWIECVVQYAPECIHGDLPPRILGTRACSAGQWGACTALETCAQYESACTPNAKLDAKYQCTDGTIKTGNMICFKALGAKCDKGYYAGWPLSDCPMLCAGPKDTCPTPKAIRPCEVHCGGPDGPVKKGTQTCQAVCDTQIWSACFTDDACLK